MARHLDELLRPHGDDRATRILGINANDLVGYYENRQGVDHAFAFHTARKFRKIFRLAPHWQEFDEPHASGETVLAGINDRDDLVGYYQNGSGRIVAFLCR